MPDLTIETEWMCSSNRRWAKEIELSPGRRYTVSFSRIFGGKYPYGYQCTCKGYRFSKGKHCRHIKHVIHNQLRCGWQGRTPVEKEGRHLCPNCGETAEPTQVAV